MCLPRVATAAPQARLFVELYGSLVSSTLYELLRADSAAAVAAGKEKLVRGLKVRRHGCSAQGISRTPGRGCLRCPSIGGLHALQPQPLGAVLHPCQLPPAIPFCSSSTSSCCAMAAARAGITCLVSEGGEGLHLTASTEVPPACACIPAQVKPRLHDIGWLSF